MRAKPDPKYGPRRLPRKVRAERERTHLAIAVAIVKAATAKRDRMARDVCPRSTPCLFPCPACLELAGPLLTGGA